MSDEQLKLLESPASYHASSGSVTCLGMEFENDNARRAYFTEQLRQKLRDPAFRAIEGFPIGADEDILSLSDPPYYTACPNPWIADFIAEWEAEKQYVRKPQMNTDGHGLTPSGEQEHPRSSASSSGSSYHREPFAADVSEGKNDPIYNAHSYHTKVPHKAIMRYILHYTEPGDIVFDGFCGTGMTGVAAQMCGDRDTVLSLGYQVKADGAILRPERDVSGNTVWTPFSKLGARKAVLNDLSPAATFIAYNYNTPVDVQAFEREAKRILQDVEKECGWMYVTIHKQPQMNTDEHGSPEKNIRVHPCSSVVQDNPGIKFGTINYTVWSDVFVCPECSGEVVFWEAAVDKAAGKVQEAFPCPHCSATLAKRTMERAWISKYDSALHETIRQAKQVPVLINYSVGKKRFEKTPDAFDLALIDQIEQTEIPYWFPTEHLPDGYNTAQPMRSHGITHVHHFYTKRNLWVLAALFDNSTRISEFQWALKLVLTGILQISSKQSSFRYDSRNPKNTAGGILKGTLYVPSIPREGSIFENYLRRLSSVLSLFKLPPSRPKNQQSCSSLENLDIAKETIDYLFIDPPFGANINYSELNTTWEAWLKVWTNNKSEAIENNVQKKGPTEYRHLMTSCFEEAFRVLKPGRWMTVEFSNTKASVWNNIQTALTDAGFIVANVSALDKKQGSFKAMTTPTAVKQDLVISAYKPNGGFSERFEQEAGTEEGAWDFVRTHLKYLPVVKMQGNALAPIPERDPRILFDQMVAFYVRKGYFVPLSSQEFQAGLRERFAERDDMFFLPEQVAEYDRKKLSVEKVVQRSLFVSDEASAIDWLRLLLKEKPQTYQEIHPQFIQQTQRAWKKTETPLELSTLLEQNFLRYDGADRVPEQIHAYLSHNWKDLRSLDSDDPVLQRRATDRWYVPDPNKAADLEKLRERTLLREFEHYKQAPRRLKIFRLEAVRAGFKKCWQERDYATIIAVAEKIPHLVLEEDSKLLMWYDQAQTRINQ